MSDMIVISDSDDGADHSWRPSKIVTPPTHVVDEDELLSFNAFRSITSASSSRSKDHPIELSDGDGNGNEDDDVVVLSQPPSSVLVERELDRAFRGLDEKPSSSYSEEEDDSDPEENFFASLGQQTSSAAAAPPALTLTARKTKKPKQTTEEKEAAKRKKEDEKEMRRQMRQSEMEEKKRKREEEKAKARAQVEQEKKRKNEARIRNRRKTTAELLAEMEIILEPAVVDNGGGSILTALQKLCATRVAALPIPASIEIYRRKKGQQQPTEDDYDDDTGGPLKHLLLRLSGKEFVERIQVMEDFTQILLSRGSQNRITLVIEGINKYKHDLSVQSNRFARAAVLQQNVNNANYGALANITQLEAQILESSVQLQLQHGIQLWYTQNADESALFLTKLTNNIANSFQRSSDPFDNFCAETVKRAAKSFQALWKSQLMIVNGVSDEVAHAIISKFPTASSLLVLYSESSALTERQKEDLLSNVPIVRADGKTMNRVVGPVLSRKIYTMFSTDDPATMIN